MSKFQELYEGLMSEGVTKTASKYPVTSDFGKWAEKKGVKVKFNQTDKGSPFQHSQSYEDDIDFGKGTQVRDARVYVKSRGELDKLIKAYMKEKGKSSKDGYYNKFSGVDFDNTKFPNKSKKK
jgi:hypothetical protein